ncbi:Protein FAM43A [Eumeta japonica]|uniref:Protein FAM43A n=1 Tax=Eumeta variegata TaxID=151549 RepID=A0A4C1YUI7_EUMVA|nr:Protein FAM43A [Eumeta japonica]
MLRFDKRLRAEADTALRSRRTSSVKGAFQSHAQVAPAPRVSLSSPPKPDSTNELVPTSSAPVQFYLNQLMGYEHERTEYARSRRGLPERRGTPVGRWNVVFFHKINFKENWSLKMSYRNERARDSCVEKPLATLWRNYQQSTKPDVVMKLSVTNSGLKGFTKEHGLTEYWSHRITYCASPPHYPKLFCWVYRHEGKKLKHELRCHAVLCSKESISKRITEDLQMKLRQALIEFKKDRISKQNARLSLANSVYDNPSMPRRKILLSVGATNYRPPLERSKSAPKLGAIEEMCSEEDEEEAEMNAKQNFCSSWTRNSLDKSEIDEFTFGRWRSENRSPRKYSCPEAIVARSPSDLNSDNTVVSNELINILVKESSKKTNEFMKLSDENKQTSHKECNGTCADTVGCRLHALECIEESNEVFDSNTTCSPKQQKSVQLLSQSNFLVSDSDDGSVSSGCETASTATSSDAEPTSLPSQFPQEEIFNGKYTKERRIPAFERIQSYEQSATHEESRSLTVTNHTSSDNCLNDIHLCSEVNAVPIGEKNVFRRRSTYPPFKTDGSLISNFESLLDNLTDIESLNSSTDTEVFKSAGDNDSACSDESGYSEPLDNAKESIIGSTIMV